MNLVMYRPVQLPACAYQHLKLTGHGITYISSQYWFLLLLCILSLGWNQSRMWATGLNFKCCDSFQVLSIDGYSRRVIHAVTLVWDQHKLTFWRVEKYVVASPVLYNWKPERWVPLSEILYDPARFLQCLVDVFQPTSIVHQTCKYCTYNIYMYTHSVVQQSEPLLLFELLQVR